MLSDAQWSALQPLSGGAWVDPLYLTGHLSVRLMSP